MPTVICYGVNIIYIFANWYTGLIFTQQYRFLKLISPFKELYFLFTVCTQLHAAGSLTLGILLLSLDREINIVIFQLGISFHWTILLVYFKYSAPCSSPTVGIILLLFLDGKLKIWYLKFLPLLCSMQLYNCSCSFPERSTLFPVDSAPCSSTTVGILLLLFLDGEINNVISQLPPLTELGWKNVATSFLLPSAQWSICENLIWKKASFRCEMTLLETFLNKRAKENCTFFYEIVSIFQLQKVLAIFR